MLDPALLDLYSDRLRNLGALVKEDRPLPEPEASVKRRSPLCGSQITFDVALDADGRLRTIGHKVRACALSEASAGIVLQAAPGSDVQELRMVRDAVALMLREDETRDVPLPGGKWVDLEVLRPAAMVPSRHGSALLAFETILAAVEEALRGRATGAG